MLHCEVADIFNGGQLKRPASIKNNNHSLKNYLLAYLFVVQRSLKLTIKCIIKIVLKFYTIFHIFF